jgi:5-methylcytosine-specific restriction endonuclease McrA
MYCKYLSKSLNGKIRCKLNKTSIYITECKTCLNFEPKANKGINKVSNKRIFVTKETYDKVYERDKGRCRLCGSSQIQLHHIVYRSENKKLINEPSNCIMLCAKCHEVVHSNKHYWQPKLKDIVGGIYG